MRTPTPTLQSASAPPGGISQAASYVVVGHLPDQIPLSDRLAAIGRLALIGALGVGVVLLGHGLLFPDTEDALLPTSEDADRFPAQEPPLRDRITVIRPEASSRRAPNSDTPSARDDRPAPSRSTQPSGRMSYGFGKPDQPGTSADSSADSPQTADKEKPPVEQTPVASRRAKSLATIASLLQAPQSGAGIVAAGPATESNSDAPPSAAPASQAALPPQTSQPPTAPAAPSGSTELPMRSSSPVGVIATPQAPQNSSDSRPTQAPPALSAPQPTAPPVQTAPTPNPQTAAAQPPALRDSVYVERLTITGSTRFSQRELAEAVQKTIAANSAGSEPSADPAFINRRLSPAELVQASEAITKLYTDRGYINSGAYVPADVLSGATPEIRVVEGKVEAIKVQVEKPGFLWLTRPLSASYVRRRLARAIKAPVQIDQLADAVKLLEQDPLIRSISTELAPGTTTGGSILNVKVRQASPLQTSLSVDNGRSPSVGRFRQQATLSYANFLGLGDQFRVGYNRSEGSQGWDFGYSLPINARNGTLSFNYSRNRGEVIEEPFRELDITSRSQSYELALRQPIKQTSTEEIALSLRGTHYRNEGVFLETLNNGVPFPFPARGTDADGKSRITALRFGQEWLKRGERDVLSLQSEFSLGINALGATNLPLPPDGRFFAWQGRGFWVHSFAPDTLFALKGQVQFANRPLVPVEQLSIGGIDTVRGYRTNTLLSDNGWFASAEFYLPILRIPKWQGVLQVIPFFDIGQGWNRGNEQPSPTRLMSVGLGLQWRMGDNFRARLDWGLPLINTTAENGRSLKEGLFFSVILSP